MEIRFHANMCDPCTSRVASALHAPFWDLGEAPTGDYGGTMEHLWVDLVGHYRCTNVSVARAGGIPLDALKLRA
jgi:hypothetical protein